MGFRKWANQAFRWYYRQRMPHIRRFMKHPVKVQREVFKQLILNSRHTEWGKAYGYRSIRNASQYADRVPVQDYESLKPYIRRMMYGEKDVLWSGQVRWFSKSSGTTNDKSKFIPVSNQNLKKCHIKGTWDTMTLYYDQVPEARQFECKSLVMGGSFQNFAPYPKTRFGDISAIMTHHIPIVGRPFFTPDRETALTSNFEEKIERIVQMVSRDKNVVSIGGVPTWTIVLFRKILEQTGKKHMLEVWPDFQLYVHGGVSFLPYRKQFSEFLPSEKVNYIESYNASEGYFAAQNDLQSNDMLLLLDNGIYYEFLPMSEWNKEYPKAVPLEEVEIGKNYAIVISTNGGLWRYTPGDTITFTSVSPFKIRVTGRTKQFVNAFGEEVMVENTDKALAETCRQLDVVVNEYTVAPIYFQRQGKGGHEWLIEFEKMPHNLEVFNTLLDINLQKVNSDYEAKRFKSMALERLQLRSLPHGTFHKWLKSKGKYGGQHKVPRLANDRKYVDEILNLVREGIG